MAVDGMCVPSGAVRGGSIGCRGAHRTGPPGSAGVSEPEMFRRSWSGPGPVHPGDPRPEESPEGRGAAGERERHPAPGEDESGACAEHALAQAAQAPAGAGGAGHGAAGDVHQLVGQDRDEQAHLVCRAKASTASEALRGLRPRQCDFGRLVDDSAGASTSLSSPMWPSAVPRWR